MYEPNLKACTSAHKMITLSTEYIHFSLEMHLWMFLQMRENPILLVCLSGMFRDICFGECFVGACIRVCFGGMVRTSQTSQSCYLRVQKKKCPYLRDINTDKQKEKETERQRDREALQTYIKPIQTMLGPQDETTATKTCTMSTARTRS